MFENPSGFTYLYAKEKISRAKKHNTHIVDEFARYFPKLKRNVLKDLRAKEAFMIIRSYFADTEVKMFFRARRTATRQEVFDLLIRIASKLGHKRFDKKEHIWVESPKVTVNNYIRPEFVERLHRYYEKESGAREDR